MRRVKLLVLLLLLGMQVVPALAQQDIQFSQYVFNGLIVNPAYAGYKGDTYLNTTYRKQWVNIPGSPQTIFAAVDGLTGAKDDRVGWGGQVMWDKLGPQDNLSLYASYAYRIPLDETGERRLCFGLSGGITQYSLDGRILSYTDPDDPELPNVRVSSIQPNANFGIYYYTPKFYIGASVLDLIVYSHSTELLYSRGYTFANLRKYPHMYLTAGVMLEVSDQIGLKPSIMVKEDFKGPTSLDINLMALFVNRLWFGASYRTGVNWSSKSGYQPNLESNAAVSLMMEFFATDNLRIGYAYDITTNGMASYQNGTHEVSIGITFPKKSSRERILSPRFF